LLCFVPVTSVSLCVFVRRFSQPQAHDLWIERFFKTVRAPEPGVASKIQ
jgi:hypothetical protein